MVYKDEGKEIKFVVKGYKDWNKYIWSEVDWFVYLSMFENVVMYIFWCWGVIYMKLI